MKIQLYRNGTWYSGLCLDEISFNVYNNYADIETINQQKYGLEQLGYEVEDKHNNPFKKTTQFEYYNEYEDKVVVRFDYKNKNELHILKQYNNIENCLTTVEVITRLGALNKLFDDIVKIFKDEYEMVGIEE
jgi:hypothetical protein